MGCVSGQALGLQSGLREIMYEIAGARQILLYAAKDVRGLGILPAQGSIENVQGKKSDVPGQFPRQA
jgi:hypothetical protein